MLPPLHLVVFSGITCCPKAPAPTLTSSYLYFPRVLRYPLGNLCCLLPLSLMAQTFLAESSADSPQTPDQILNPSLMMSGPGLPGGVIESRARLPKFKPSSATSCPCDFRKVTLTCTSACSSMKQGSKSSPALWKLSVQVHRIVSGIY